MGSPLSGTPEKIDPLKLRSYWEALGRFIAAFSMVEARLQHMLRQYANVSDVVAKALFSDARIDRAMGFIRRIAAGEKWDQKKVDELDCLFRRLTTINQVRNDIVHYGAEFWTNDLMFVTNALLALTEAQIRTTPVSAAILDDMTTDLLKLNFHLLEFAWKGQMPAELRQTLNPIRASAWRYKPPRQAPNLFLRPVPPPKRQRRRRPSPA